jgi:hypothetical protein
MQKADKYGMLNGIEVMHMCLGKWYDSKVKKLKMWDFAVMKAALIIFGIIIGAYIPEIVKKNLWYFVVVWAVLYAILLYKVFRK